MPFLAAAAPYIALASTAVGAYTQMEGGKAAEANANLQALQDERDANSAQVKSQAEAAQERKKSRYLRSRALAVAGASGGGVSDPTINKILSGIDTEGEMNALTSLWSGDETARALKLGAQAKRREGKAAKSSAYLSAFTSLVGGATSFASAKPSFFQKYGGDRAASIGKGTGYSDFAGTAHADEWVA